jgi:hypothetical protein
MDSISAEKIKELAVIHKPYCLSIFIPTFRAGVEVNEKLDQKHLKNQVKTVRNELESLGLKEREIEQLIKPVNGLIEDSGFWKLQSDGLAIFRNMDFFEYYTLPVNFEPMAHVADHFYPLPLMPYINDEITYYLLAISMNNLRFFEGFPYQINEVEVKDLLPGRFEDVVGYDFEEKHLQFRSGNDDRGRATFHGHGVASQEESKTEIMKYLRAVNNGIMEFLHDKNSPLIIAAVEYLVPIYREVNSYKYLHKEFIGGNPEYEDPVMLHRQAKELLKDHFGQIRSDKAKIFEQALAGQKASYKEEEVVPAAVNGRIDTLFVQKGEKLWGIYDSESNTIYKRSREDARNSCLMNLAAMHTLINGGRVFLMAPENMPEPSSRLNAILRY